jgi:hypothetical protein
MLIRLCASLGKLDATDTEMVRPTFESGLGSGERHGVATGAELFVACHSICPRFPFLAGFRIECWVGIGLALYLEVTL